MRWTRQRRRAIEIAGRLAVSDRSVQTNGADADGEAVWS
jgi:hypothetical protein